MSVTAVQLPLPVVVRIRFTKLPAISPAVGAYDAPSAFGDGENKPSPPDHCPPAAKFTKPLRFTVALLPHTVWLLPALDIGAGAYVMITWSDTGKHVPLPDDVKVRVTLPLLISAALGV